ncbi:TPA: hypothetical protein N4790_004520 [Shigella sonnei]|nr:hypothetical protein [Shigella sonnei]
MMESKITNTAVPENIVNYILSGGLLEDNKETCDKLVSQLLPIRSEYCEIVILGSEYCVRSYCRRYEALRVPRTLGGVILLISSFQDAHVRVATWIAKGGNSGF